jgi:hypothetical protein
LLILLPLLSLLVLVLSSSSLLGLPGAAFFLSCTATISCVCSGVVELVELTASVSDSIRGVL